MNISGQGRVAATPPQAGLPHPHLSPPHLWCPHYRSLGADPLRLGLLTALPATIAHSLWLRLGSTPVPSGPKLPASLPRASQVTSYVREGKVVRAPPQGPLVFVPSPLQAQHTRITEQAPDNLPPHPRPQVPRQGQQSAPCLQALTQVGECESSRGFTSRSCSAALGHQMALIDQKPALMQGGESLC